MIIDLDSFHLSGAQNMEFVIGKPVIMAFQPKANNIFKIELTLLARYILESCIKIKINLSFIFTKGFEAPQNSVRINIFLFSQNQDGKG